MLQTASQRNEEVEESPPPSTKKCGICCIKNEQSALASNGDEVSFDSDDGMGTADDAFMRSSKKWHKKLDVIKDNYSSYTQSPWTTITCTVCSFELREVAILH